MPSALTPSRTSAPNYSNVWQAWAKEDVQRLGTHGLGADIKGMQHAMSNLLPGGCLMPRKLENWTVPKETLPADLVEKKTRGAIKGNLSLLNIVSRIIKMCPVIIDGSK